LFKLRFLRKYLNEKQFLTTVANSFYSTLFYGSTVWYHSSKANDLKQIDSLYYRLLRTACRDFKKEISRVELKKRCKRASPREWVNYLTASKAIKVIRDQHPSLLYCKIVSNYYEEPRKPQQGMFFDSSKSRTGRQSLENRLDLIKEINQPWNNGLNNDALRVLLKKTFFQYCK